MGGLLLGTLACGETTRDAGDTALTGASGGDAGGGSEGPADPSMGSGGGGSGGGTGSGESGDAGGNGGTESGSGNDGDSGGDLRLDVGQGGSSGGDGGSGQMPCEKVDFLFVVDNSGSMGTAQTNLATSFPGFISTIRDQVQGRDYHIMVVDSDDDASWSCEPSAQAGDPACAPNCKTECVTTGSMCAGYRCGHNATLDPEDRTLGCGVVRPYGGGAPNRDCGVEGGRRYLTASQPDLEDTFACIATTGVSGDWWEQPAGAMLAALSPEFNAPGGCNEGFLRRDAILVVTFISDDVENNFDQDDVRAGFGGTPQEWYDTLVAAKGGNADAIVMLGVLATPNATFNPVTCQHGGSLAGLKFMEFVDLFGDQGMYVDSCTADYAPFFEQAVELIDWTCDIFDPVG